MSSHFIGEIQPFPFGVVPTGWAACQGQLLPINQNQALFSLLGTMYGGDGSTTFALPDLRGRTPICSGSGYTQGEAAGEEQHQLTLGEMPTHNHLASASNNVASVQATASTTTALGVTSDASGVANTLNIYGTGTGSAALASQTIGSVGANQAHSNQMPYLAINFCIALAGVFPSRS